MNSKKISIITITFNSDSHLAQTIASVATQSYENFEYIIIDGGSTDNTLEIIQANKKNIDLWISEPDNGIADAMNKGLSVASGEYILFLHSDDYLLDNTVIEKAAQHLDGQTDIILLDIYLEKNKHRTYSRPRGFNWWLNFKNGIHHQSVFCCRKLFQKIGNFDEKFRIAMDYDFFLRAYRDGASNKKINMPLAVMRMTGVSSQKDWPTLLHRFTEEKKVHFKNCPNHFMSVIYMIFWNMYLPYRKLLFALQDKKGDMK